MITPIILPAPPPPIKLSPVPQKEIELPPKPVIKPKPRTKPEVVLVSGLAFPRQRGEKIRDVFSNYCKTMATKLNAKYTDVKITVFNFYDSAQQQYEFDGATLKITNVKSWDKISQGNYRYVREAATLTDEPILTTQQPTEKSEVFYFPGISDISKTKDVTKTEYLDAFFDGKLKEKSISIKDVYEYISDVGKSSDRYIAEFHIFSRKFEGDPTLVRTRTFRVDSINFKDKKYLDKDGRSGDFMETNTTENTSPPVFKASTMDSGVDIKNFYKAFADGKNWGDITKKEKSFSMLWGSNFNLMRKDIIQQILNSKLYKDGDFFKLKYSFTPYLKLKHNPELEKLSDNNEINLKHWESLGEGKDWYHFCRYLSDHKAYGTFSGESSPQSPKSLVKFIYYFLFYDYEYRLGKASNNKVFAAPAGTDVNLDNEVTQKRYGIPLMHVFMGTKYRDPASIPDYTEILEFYSKIQYRFIWDEAEYQYKTYFRGYAYPGLNPSDL